HEGRQVLLYIKDTRKALRVVMTDPTSLQKFHFFDCRKLDEMRAANRFERYVVIQRQTGDFPLDVTDPHTRTLHQDVIARLHVAVTAFGPSTIKAIGIRRKAGEIGSLRISTSPSFSRNITTHSGASPHALQKQRLPTNIPIIG